MRWVFLDWKIDRGLGGDVGVPPVIQLMPRVMRFGRQCCCSAGYLSEAFYGCDEAKVVTNSYFTGRNLATAGCGSRQPPLVEHAQGAVNSQFHLTSSTLPPHATNFSR